MAWYDGINAQNEAIKDAIQKPLQSIEKLVKKPIDASVKTYQDYGGGARGLGAAVANDAAKSYGYLMENVIKPTLNPKVEVPGVVNNFTEGVRGIRSAPPPATPVVPVAPVVKPEGKLPSPGGATSPMVAGSLQNSLSQLPDTTAQLVSGKSVGTVYPEAAPLAATTAVQAAQKPGDWVDTKAQMTARIAPNDQMFSKPALGNNSVPDFTTAKGGYIGARTDAEAARSLRDRQQQNEAADFNISQMNRAANAERDTRAARLGVSRSVLDQMEGRSIGEAATGGNAPLVLHGGLDPFARPGDSWGDSGKRQQEYQGILREAATGKGLTARQREAMVGSAQALAAPGMDILKEQTARQNSQNSLAGSMNQSQAALAGTRYNADQGLAGARYNADQDLAGQQLIANLGAEKNAVDAYNAQTGRITANRPAPAPKNGKDTAWDMYTNALTMASNPENTPQTTAYYENLASRLGEVLRGGSKTALTPEEMLEQFKNLEKTK